MNIGKLGDPHHVKDFLKMSRNPGNSDLLVILLGLRKDLDQHRNSPAVDVGIGTDLQQDLAGSLIVGILVSFGQKWL